IYMKSMIESKYPFILTYNPFFHFVDIYQNIFLYSKAPSFEAVFSLVFMTLVLLIIAGYLYKKMITTIKDII
ncbi:MAG: ABC transporter permease, partial [Campylobacterota bacterium]|nr:ABC transporter permease [Campylobacterota bacterium]